MTTAPRRLPWPAVAGLTALGLTLRAFHMTAQSLWYDEVGSMTVALKPFGAMLDAVRTGTGVEPTAWLSAGYHAVLRLFLLLPHDAPDWPARLSSVVIGTLTIPAFAWTTAALVGARAALVATGLLAISPFHVWYSQEVRPYVLLLLLVVLTLGALLRAVGDREARWWWGVGLGTALALYTHPIGLGLAAICGVVVLAHWRVPAVPWRGGLALAAAGVAFLPVVLLVRAHGGNSPADARPTGLLDVGYAFYAWAVGFSLGPSTHELHVPTPDLLLSHLPLIAVVALVFGGLGLAGFLAMCRLPSAARWVALTWLVLPLGLTLTLALLTANPFNVRYAIVSFPAFVAAIALGAARLDRRIGAAAMLVVTLLSAAALHRLYFDAHYAKEDTRGLAAHLRAEARPDDLVLVNAAYMANAVRYYYPGPAELVGYPPRDGRGPALDPQATAADLDRLTAGRARVWLILSRTFHGDAAGVLARVLRAERRLEAEQHFAGIAAYRFVD